MRFQITALILLLVGCVPTANEGGDPLSGWHEETVGGEMAFLEEVEDDGTPQEVSAHGAEEPLSTLQEAYNGGQNEGAIQSSDFECFRILEDPSALLCRIHRPKGPPVPPLYSSVRPQGAITRESVPVAEDPDYPGFARLTLPNAALASQVVLLKLWGVVESSTPIFGQLEIDLLELPAVPQGAPPPARP